MTPVIVMQPIVDFNGAPLWFLVSALVFHVVAIVGLSWAYFQGRHS